MRRERQIRLRVKEISGLWR